MWCSLVPWGFQKIDKMEKLIYESREVVLSGEFCQHIARCFRWVVCFRHIANSVSIQYNYADTFCSENLVIDTDLWFNMLFIHSRSAGRAGKPVIKWNEVFDLFITSFSFHFILHLILMYDSYYLLLPWSFFFSFLFLHIVN